jgi:hypothetical protein
MQVAAVAGCLRLRVSGGEGRHLNQIIAVPHSDQTTTFC